MAVRAADIALGDLGEDLGPTATAEHRADVHVFLAVDVIELEDPNIGLTTVDAPMRTEILV